MCNSAKLLDFISSDQLQASQHHLEFCHNMWEFHFPLAFYHKGLFHVFWFLRFWKILIIVYCPMFPSCTLPSPSSFFPPFSLVFPGSLPPGTFLGFMEVLGCLLLSKWLGTPGASVHLWFSEELWAPPLDTFDVFSTVKWSYSPERRWMFPFLNSKSFPLRNQWEKEPKLTSQDANMHLNPICDTDPEGSHCTQAERIHICNISKPPSSFTEKTGPSRHMASGVDADRSVTS